MTVHASKGLEAAVVFMVDPGNAAWSAGRAPKLLSFDMAEPDGYEGKGFLWLPKSDYGTGFTAELLEELKTRSEEEYRRLLYVGMTRAEDRLILCGYRGERESENTWLKLASDGLGDEAVAYDHPVEGVSARRYRKTELAELEIQDKADATETAYPPLPEHYRRPLEPEQGLPRPLTPSGASALIEADAEQVVRSGSPVLEQGVQSEDSGRSFGLQRGTVIHTLLQRLPDLPAEQREQAAQRYLNIAAGDWHESQREKVLAAVSTILEDPQFAAVFSPASKAEISLMGKLQLRGKEQVVSGQIDRICIEDDRVLIVDYKSNRPPARTQQEVPQAYITQLALYRALVEPLYPHKRVEAALLFTEGPHLIVLDEDVMEQALIALGKAV
jgi:ATP-dependent helicase/nuclease subunit A